MESNTASTSNETVGPSVASENAVSPTPVTAPSLETVTGGLPLLKKKIKTHLSFRSLVIVIDTRRDYYWNIWFSIVLGLLSIFIGSVNMTVIAYSAQTGDVHAALCTVAFHFFSAEAILGLNYANGWSAPMRMRHRRLAHVILQICGLACVLTGFAFVINTHGLTNKKTSHGITGLVTTGLAGLSFISGPCALVKNRYLKILHTTFGMPTFLISSISLCLGFVTDAFMSWATTVIVYILIGFVSFYTTFIFITVLVKCASRL